MAALIIVNYDVVDPDALVDYRKGASPVLFAEGRATRVVITDSTVDLGEGDGVGTHTVVLRFDSAESARAVWESAEYRALVPQRLAATRPRFAMLVDTVADA